MESRHISTTAACSGAAASPSCAAGTPTAGSATSSKLMCLRRYVTDSAARLLVNKDTAGSGGPHKAAGTRTIVNQRKRGVDESHLGASETRQPNRKPRGTKNKPGFHLRLHDDALGEAEAPLPRTSPAVRRRRSKSSSREAAAVSFDALQYGRLHHPRAAAYSLTKQDSRQDIVNIGGVKWKTGTPGEEQHSFHYDSDEGSEAPVVVTLEEEDSGKNSEFHHSSVVSGFTPKVSSRRDVSGLEEGQPTLPNTSADASRTSFLTGRLARSELSKLGRITCVEEARAGARQSGGLGRAQSFEGDPRRRHSLSTDERKDSEDDKALLRAEQIAGAGQISSMTNIVQRLPANVQSWTAQDGDLSPPRRDPNLRFQRGSPRRALDDTDGVRGSQTRANITRSFAVWSQHKVSVLSNGRESSRPRNSSFYLPVQSNTIGSPPEMMRSVSGVGDHVRTKQRRSSFSRPAASLRHSNAEHWRNSRNTSEARDGTVPLPNVTMEPMRDPETRRHLSTNTTEFPRTYEGKNMRPDDGRAFTRTRASTARDDGRHPTDSEMSSERRLRRDSGDLCDGKNPIASAAPDARNRRSHGSPSPRRVVYRDSRGRIITQEEWLELRGPLAGRRRPGRLNTERAPKVELAWGKGLVQQEERAQATAEEALLGRQPLARYELDKDFDLVLQRRQRWDDPVAKLLDRSSLPREAAETSSPEYREASRKGRSEGASGKAADKPKCPFDAPKNRFGIEPGYRWDGVVRGNGYEDRRLKALTKRKLDEQLKHTNNVADM